MSRARLVVVGIVLALAAACGSTPGGPDAGPPTTLRVLAGSELADMGPVLDRAAAATGVRLDLRYSGSLAGADEVASGRADGTTDAVWFSSTRYLDLDPRTRSRIGTAVPVMSSPVVLGLTRPVAARLGWDRRPVTWADITAAAGNRQFSFGMTDPSMSNSGFSALVGVAAAADGSGTAPDLAAVARAAPALSAFFSAQALTSGSSGYLTDAYVDRATGRVPGAPVDGIVTYEASLQSLDRSGRLPEPLVPIYPTDGVVTADYPLTALTSAPPAAREAVTRLTDWLRSPAGQQDIATTTDRRPVAPGSAPRPDQPPVVELPFPASQDVVNGLLGAYFDRFRRPARTVYVLDTSGSMTGPRLASLQQALVGLTGGDGTSAPIRAREDVTLLPFSGAPAAPQRSVVDPASPETARAGLRDAAGRLTAGGETAIYDALGAAFTGLAADAAADPSPRISSVVLMTDGENTSGTDAAAGLAALDARAPSTRGVPVFPILFGEAAVPEMTAIAAHTGGKVFDARTVPLPEIFRQIRGYQ